VHAYKGATHKTVAVRRFNCLAHSSSNRPVNFYTRVRVRFITQQHTKLNIAEIHNLVDQN